MSEQTVAIANGEPDIGFNMLSLRFKGLCQRKCQKCCKESAEWKISCLCHHKICIECLNANKNNVCQVCDTPFDPQLHLSNKKKMETALFQLEKLIYFLKALEKGTLNPIQIIQLINQISNEDSQNNFTMDLNNTHIDDNVIQETVEPNVIELQNNSSRRVSDSSQSQNNFTMDLNNTHIDDNMIQETVEPNVIELQTNPSRRLSDSSQSNVSSVLIHNNLLLDDVETDYINNVSPDNSDRESNLTRCNSESSMDMFGQSQNTEPEEEENEQSDIEMNLNSNNEQITESINEQSDNIDFSSSCSSDTDDFIVGTPERTLLSSIKVSITGVQTDAEINIIKQMVYMFNLQAQTKWTSDITHLVAVVHPDNRCDPTKKFLNAILNHCYIVKFQWVLDCVDKKSLLPEEQYFPLNTYGEESPLISVKVGQGHIESPLEWCKNCGLHFHDSLRLCNSLKLMIDLAKKAGFVVYNKLEDFKDSQLKMRIILCYNHSEDEKNEQKLLPDDKLIKGWIHDYKAVTLSYDWFVDCIISYKFVPIKTQYQILPIDRNTVILEEMDESLFVFSNE